MNKPSRLNDASEPGQEAEGRGYKEPQRHPDHISRRDDVYPAVGSESRTTAHDEGYDEQHQKHDKQYLGDTRGSAGDTTEAQNRSDDGNDQKCNSLAQHSSSPRLF